MRCHLRGAAICVMLATVACDGIGKGSGDADAADRLSRADIVRGETPLPWVISRRPIMLGEDSPFRRVDSKLFGVDERGNMYGYDDYSGAVVVIDSLGVEQGRFGGRGGGPGEFAAPTGLGVAPNGTTVIFDMAKLALVQFDSSRVPAGELRLDGIHAGGPIGWSASGWLVAEQRLDRPTRSVVRSLSLVRSGAPPTVVASVVEPLPTPSRFDGCPAPVLLPRLFAARAMWSASAAGVVLADEGEYVVSWFDERGQRIRRIANPTPLRAVTRAEALDEVQRIPAGALALRECRVSPEALADAAGSAAVHQAIGEMALAPDGILWVRRAGTVDGRGEIDLYGSDGAPLGRLPATTPFPAAFINAENYVAILAEADGQTGLEVVRVRRP